jgi:membrane-associated protease RseP (regulator of RpoE activity)
MSDLFPPAGSVYDAVPPPEVIVVRPRRPRYWLHALLFLLTVFSTLIVGARLQYNFLRGAPAFALAEDFFPIGWVMEDPWRLWLGRPFSGTLLLILLAHEMGHYVYCKRHGVAATLPYFLPAPTLFGTLGAFIRIRSPIYSRAALFDIGISGPIAGFVVALPALAIGLALSQSGSHHVQQSQIVFGYPPIFDWMWAYVWPGAKPFHVEAATLHLHPVAFAAWVGMFATALNLLPAGQLDGGHIVYARWPRAHRWGSRALVAVLVPMGIWFWTGWLVWAVLLFFLGARHPQVPEWPDMGRGRRLLAVVALVMLLVTISPAPIIGSSGIELIRQVFSE